MKKNKAKWQDWNSQLPYPVKNNWLSSIKEDLACIVQSSNSIGITEVTSNLKLYLELKLEINSHDLAWFAKIFYSIITESNSTTSSSFCDLFIQLAQDEEDLPSHCLQLEWKPLYNTIFKYMYPQHGRSFPSNASTLSSLIKLAKSANRFFKSDATREILSAILPLINLHDSTNFCTYIGLLTILLPVDRLPLQSNSQEEASNFYWVPILIYFWSCCGNSSTLDMLFLDIFGRLAKYHGSYPVKIGWSSLDMAFIFSRGTRLLCLSVGSGTSGIDAKHLAKKGLSDSGIMDLGMPLGSYFHTSKTSSFAKIIVYSLSPVISKDGTDTISHFETFIRAVEPFCHPSNSGKWTSPLAKLFLEISQNLHERWIQDDPHQTPFDFNTLDKVTRLIGTIIQMMVFGKDSSSISSSQSAFKFISWINPDAVIPQFLSAANPSLQGLSETHRTISCLGTLYSIASPLIRRSHYPQGGSSIISLLCLSLPGLDVNDIQKSITTLIFIFSAISNVPLINSSMHSYTEKKVALDNPDLASSSVYDDTCRQSTADLELWLTLFMERIFIILENLPQNYGVGDNSTIEGNLLETIYFTCHAVFSQLSGDLEDVVMRMLFKKAQSSLIPAATEAIGSLCGLIGTSEKRLALFVPFCIEGIKLEVENGAGSVSSGNRFVANPNPFDFALMSDASLHWYQSILLKVVSNSGSALLKYRDDLMEVIKLMASKCASKRGYLWTGQLISNILDSLSGVYPEDFRSHPPSDWSNPDFSKESYLRWGEFFEVSALEIRWHIPSQQEKAFAFDLAQDYFRLCIAKLEELMVSTNLNASSSEFSKWLSILNHCIMGCCTFLQPPEGSKNDEYHGEFTKIYSPSHSNLNLRGGFLFKQMDKEHSLWSEVISETQNLFFKMLDYFTNHRMDDIESIKALLHCIKIHLSYGGPYDSASWIYSYSKTILKAGKDETALPRSVLVSRVFMLHLRRVQEIIKSNPTSVSIFTLVCRLHDFSLSKYAEIRKTAQTALFSALRYHRNLRFHITHQTLNVLKESGDRRDPDRIKGALYVLKDRFSIMGVYIYYCEFTAQFIDAILFNHAEEKPSILDMIRQIVLEFSSLFFPAEYPEKISQNPELSKEIIPNHDKFEDYLKIKALVDRNSEIAIKSTISHLIICLSNNINWRFESMAIHFLDMIITKSVKITPDIISSVFSKLFEPNPTVRLNSHSLLSHIIDILKDITSNSEFSNRKKILARGSHEYQQVITEIFNFGKTDGSQKKYYVDKPIGWILLPATLKVYSLDTPSIHSFFNDDENGSLLVEKIREVSFWDKLLFFAGEESSKEQFKSSNADFYKRLFMIIQDSCFEILLPKVDTLVSKTQENNSQRLASELIGGIIRGSKHWSFLKKARVEKEVYPLLLKGLQFATIESIRHWLGCIRYILSRRDPSRLIPIVDHIISLPLDITSTFFLAESKKLWLKDLLLQTCSFRVRFHASKIQEQLANYVSTPFQQVRDAFGRCFDDCLQLSWSENYATLQDLIDHHSQTVFEPFQLPINSHILSIKHQLTEFKKLPYKAGTSSSYSNSCKSVLAWFGYALTSYQVPGIVNTFPLMVSLLLEMSDFPDVDLSLMATQISKIYPNFLHNSSQLNSIFDILINLASPLQESNNLEAPSWHIKTRVLPILQVFYFRHIFFLSKETRDRIVFFLDSLLSDQQVEVRRLASISLSGIVQCSAKSSIDVLINRYRANLTSLKIPKRKRSEPLPEGYSKILNQRHASILGLSSLVLAFPYELPEWMPNVLVLLASCSSDPSPISNSISHVFGEFKRTHQDSWESDKLKFTEEDLYIVSDLIYSPGYFA